MSRSPDAAPPRTPNPTPPAPEPLRVIGGLGAFSIVAGSMLGVGIFVMTPDVAAGMGSVGGFFAMLVLGALFALAGAVACGELGAMMPHAGGDYVFQRAAFGPSLAFGSGWTLFAGIFAGSVALMAVALFQFDIGPLLGVDLAAPIAGHFTRAHACAIALIAGLTLMNDLGAALSARAQTALTLLPLALFIGLAGYVLIGAPPVVHPAAQAALPDTVTLSGLGAAFLAVNYIFSGWINIIYVASEVKEPGKNIPRSMLSATTIVTIVYVLLAAAMVQVLDVGGIAAAGETGTATATALGGGPLVTVVLVAVSIAILTSINATILASGRIGYAMAKDGAFFKPFAHLSGPRRTPRRALRAHAVMAIALVLVGSFDAITRMTSIAMFVTGSLTVLSLFVLRRTMPDAPRPYRAAFYPWLPALYLVVALVAIGIQVKDAFAHGDVVAWYPLIGLGILCATWVGHLLWTRRIRPIHSVESNGVEGDAEPIG
ncbi:MAG: amino acid permease [Myxococcota bacterium]